MGVLLADLRRVDTSTTSWILVTIVETRGSTPREIGAAMVVTAVTVSGTIGGGELEFRAIATARELLSDVASNDGSTENLNQASRHTRDERFSLGARLGQCCGGQAVLWFEHRDVWSEHLQSSDIDADKKWVSIAKKGDFERTLHSMDQSWENSPLTDVNALTCAHQLLLEPLASAQWLAVAGDEYFLQTHFPQDFHIWIFGAGHVGRAAANILVNLPATITCIDSRSEYLSDASPVDRFSRAPALEVALAPAGTCFCVMTHSHALDAEICEQILRRDDYTYAGLIGSRAKRRSFEKRWRKIGLTEQQIDKLQCPIAGLDDAAGLEKDPGVIALGLAKELLSARTLKMRNLTRTD